jgi:hypothetical protein
MGRLNPLGRGVSWRTTGAQAASPRLSTGCPTFAEEWLAEYPDSKGLKRSTRRGYEQIVRLHLIPEFGRLKLGDVTVERIEQHLATKRREGYSPASLNRQLNVLSLVMKRPFEAVASLRIPSRLSTGHVRSGASGGSSPPSRSGVSSVPSMS